MTSPPRNPLERSLRLLLAFFHGEVGFDLKQEGEFRRPRRYQR